LKFFTKKPAQQVPPQVNDQIEGVIDHLRQVIDQLEQLIDHFEVIIDQFSGVIVILGLRAH
jgi:hypothetical protein